jgi:hypothetical protein
MSKDGDWVIRETQDACERVLAELEARGATYRAGAPLDVRWLAGGWSSHFEFFDDKRRRIRCDFVSRPPRVPAASLASLFDRAGGSRLVAVDPESLILMKQTQRAKDYAVITELAALLSPEREIELTTDPDRILALATAGTPSRRPAAVAALSGAGRRAVVAALAEEADRLQRQDASRLEAYDAVAEPYLAECRTVNLAELPLREAHARLCDIAARTLPTRVRWSPDDADVE